MINIYRPQSAVKLNLARAYIFGLVMSFISGAAAVFSLNASIIAAISGTVLTILLSVFLYKRAVSFRLSVGEGRIKISSASVFSHQTELDPAEIRYFQLIQSPLQRAFGVCSVIFRTSSGAMRISDIAGGGLCLPTFGILLHSGRFRFLYGSGSMAFDETKNNY